MSFSFSPSSAASNAFRVTMADSMAERLTVQSELQSGLHSSRSDTNEHLTVKNADGKPTGHIYGDGAIKDFNGSLGWLK